MTYICYDNGGYMNTGMQRSSATPVFAALPILTNETKGDIGYATNVVTTSTILFIIVVPLLMTILKFL